jgi:hypothetical protein
VEIWIRLDGINSVSNFKPRPPNSGEIATMLKVKKRLSCYRFTSSRRTFSLVGHFLSGE